MINIKNAHEIYDIQHLRNMSVTYMRIILKKVFTKHNRKVSTEFKWL